MNDARRPIIEMRHVSHRFADGTIGLEDVNLVINEGEVILFTGPNGAGKTTLFRHLIGLSLPQQGEVLIDGVSVARNARHARERIGLVFQDADCQIVGETVGSDVAFGPENLRLDRKEIDLRVRRALAAVGLDGLYERRPHTLSGGEKRRLAIAGILAMEPQVLALDEPFANLDYPGMRSMFDILSRLIDMQRTVLISSHQVEALLPLLSRMVLLQEGRCIADGHPMEIMRKAVAMGLIAPGCPTEMT
jgi:biotin transport system ATP-binding protein